MFSTDPNGDRELIAFTSIRYGITSGLSDSSSIVPLDDAAGEVRRELKSHRLERNRIAWITSRWLINAIQQISLGNADAIELFSAYQARYCILSIYREPNLWVSNAVWNAHIDLTGKARIGAPFCRPALIERAKRVWEFAEGVRNEDQ